MGDLQLRILIIDDDANVRRSLSRTLCAFAEVTDVYSAATALALLNRGQTFDVVVTDLHLDKMSGNEFYEVLRAEHPALLDRFILITGSELADIDPSFRQMLGDRLLRKPVDLDVLRSRVFAILHADRSTEPPTTKVYGVDDP